MRTASFELLIGVKDAADAQPEHVANYVGRKAEDRR